MPDFHVQHFLARALALVRRLHHLHDLERGDRRRAKGRARVGRHGESRGASSPGVDARPTAADANPRVVEITSVTARFARECARAGAATTIESDVAVSLGAAVTSAARPVVVPIAGRLRAAGAARRAPPGRHAAHPARDTVAVTHRSHRRAVRVLLGRTGDGGAAAGVEPRRAGGDGEPHGAARGAHRHVLPVGAGGARRAKELRGARGTEHRAVARQGPRGGDARRRPGPGVLRRALRTDVGRGGVSKLVG